MMKRSLLLLLPLIAVCFSAAPARSQSGAQLPAAVSKNRVKKVQEMVFQHSKAFPVNTQLSIALIENGAVSFYGFLRTPDSITAISNEDRIFEIGSITKVFTSTVLAGLVTEGALHLEDRINSYYPFLFHDNIQPDLKSLANHSSGLPRLPSNFAEARMDPLNPYRNYDVQYLEAYLKNQLKLQQPAGEKYEYSNLGAGLLGYTLGLSQKTSFTELLKKRVFDKYKMRHTYTHSQQAGQQLVRGLNDKGAEVPNWDFDVLFAGGGILSSTRDLSKFAMAQFDSTNRELALTRVPTFTVNDRMQIGLAWHIIRSDYGKELFWHNGGTGGYSSSMAIDVASKKGVILLSNVSAFHPEKGHIDQLCFALMWYIETNGGVHPPK